MWKQVAMSPIKDSPVSHGTEIVTIPIFTGVPSDLHPWLNWMEEFFSQEDYNDDERLWFSESFMEGEALSWLYDQPKRYGFQSWEQLKNRLLWRFGDFDDPEFLQFMAMADPRQEWREIKEKRDATRMKTKSINIHDSVSSKASIQELITIESVLNQQKIEEEESKQGDEVSMPKKKSHNNDDLSFKTQREDVNRNVVANVILTNLHINVCDSVQLRFNVSVDHHEMVSLPPPVEQAFDIRNDEKKVILEKASYQKGNNWDEESYVNQDTVSATLEAVEIGAEGSMEETIGKLVTNSNSEYISKFSAHHLFDILFHTLHNQRKKKTKKVKGFKFWKFKFKLVYRQHDWVYALVLFDIGGSRRMVVGVRHLFCIIMWLQVILIWKRRYELGSMNQSIFEAETSLIKHKWRSKTVIIQLRFVVLVVKIVTMLKKTSPKKCYKSLKFKYKRSNGEGRGYISSYVFPATFLFRLLLHVLLGVASLQVLFYDQKLCWLVFSCQRGSRGLWRMHVGVFCLQFPHDPGITFIFLRS